MTCPSSFSLAKAPDRFCKNLRKYFATNTKDEVEKDSLYSTDVPKGVVQPLAYFLDVPFGTKQWMPPSNCTRIERHLWVHCREFAQHGRNGAVGLERLDKLGA
jgi:hypothetical protein